MSSISIRRAHNLSQVSAVKAVNSVAARLKDEYAVKAHWQESTLHFERLGLSGTLQLAAKEVVLEMQLGFLLTAFRDSIALAIERTLDEELGVKPIGAKRVRR